MSALSLVLVPSLGLATGVQAPPDACSISVRRVPPGTVAWNPTAHALESANVSTPVKSASLVRFAGEASDHRAPSQRNASG